MVWRVIKGAYSYHSGLDLSLKSRKQCRTRILLFHIGCNIKVRSVLYYVCVLLYEYYYVIGAATSYGDAHAGSGYPHSA